MRAKTFLISAAIALMLPFSVSADEALEAAKSEMKAGHGSTLHRLAP